MSIPALLAIVMAFAVPLMLGLWLVQCRTGDAGIVDVGWSGGLGIAALMVGLLAGGDPAHRIALVAVACPWSFRLAGYLLRDRVLSGEEDGRYQTLRAGWGENVQRNLLFFFLFQAVLIGTFSVPYVVVASQRVGSFGLLDVLGVVLGLGAIAGESLSDAQLKAWRRKPENKGKTCRAGLWAYSRHPNYFFEWLHWWAYVLLAVGSWKVLGTLVGPALMILFLYRFTGIPYTERQAVKSRGDDYRRYQEEVSPFIPWWPKGSTSGE
jgi:steroid 5-alpha reductase family enzyme